MNKKLGYWVLLLILFTSSAALQQQRLAKTKRNVIISAKSKQKWRYRPTRRTATLGISEDFDVLLSQTVYNEAHFSTSFHFVAFWCPYLPWLRDTTNFPGLWLSCELWWEFAREPLSRASARCWQNGPQKTKDQEWAPLYTPVRFKVGFRLFFALEAQHIFKSFTA